MAEQKAVAAPFPSPPPFYKHFTKQNLSRLRQIRQDAGVPTSPVEPSSTADEALPDVGLLSLPPELRYLVPPEPPLDGEYSSFGATIDLKAPEPTLESAGIEQLYPSDPSVHLNPQPHLIGLARSLLTSFLSLTGILSQNPELYHDRVQDLQTIMYNMHDLINQYRPHQARESLILMMEERVERMRAEIQAIDDAKQKLANLFRDVQDTTVLQADRDEDDAKPSDSTDDAAAAQRVQQQRDVWAKLSSQLAGD